MIENLKEKIEEFVLTLDEIGVNIEEKDGDVFITKGRKVWRVKVEDMWEE